jgi:D-xylose transport system substrate-binding protein
MSEIDRLMDDALAGRISRAGFLRRAFALGLSGAMLSMGLAACGGGDDDGEAGGGGGDGEQPFVGFSFPSFEHFRWAHDRRYFETRADELGMRYVIQGAEEDPTVQEQQVDAMLAQGIQALVIIPVNIESGVALVDRVKSDAEIPIISYNFVTPTASMDYWTARDNFQVGELQAKEALEKAEKGNWVIVSGPPGVDVAQQKTEGAMRVIQPHIDSGEITIVSQEFHEGWSPESALNQVENALTQTNNDIQAVVANEDGLCLGSLQALTEQGLDGEVWICGEDVFPEVAQGIVAGTISASAWTDLIQMGQSAANAAYALARGETPESNDEFDADGTMIPGMRIDSRLVTRENLEEFLELTDWLKPEDVGL